LQPSVVFLEEAPAYTTRPSSPFKQIVEGLRRRGYAVDWKVLHIEDHGLPSGRERLFLRATKGSMPAWPAKRAPVSWFDAIGAMLPSLPVGKLAPWQKRHLDDWGMPLPGEPLLITGGNKGARGSGSNKRYFVHRFPHELSWAIQKAKGMGSMRAIDADGVVRDVTPRAVSVLQGFPAWYPIEKLGKTRALDILGNSVPPLMAAQLLAPFA